MPVQKEVVNFRAIIGTTSIKLDKFGSTSAKSKLFAFGLHKF